MEDDLPGKHPKNSIAVRWVTIAQVFSWSLGVEEQTAIGLQVLGAVAYVHNG
jgi:hypothetical protein